MLRMFKDNGQQITDHPDRNITIFIHTTFKVVHLYVVFITKDISELLFSFYIVPNTGWYIIVLRFDDRSIVKNDHHSIHFFINVDHFNIKK